MPKKQRIKTQYPGIFYYQTESPDGRPDRVYYSRFRKNGKLIDDKEGYGSRGMTAAKANLSRAEKIAEKKMTNREAREYAARETNKLTFDKLFENYRQAHPHNKDQANDKSRQERYISPRIGKKIPAEVTELDFQYILNREMKDKSDKTKRNVVELIERLANYGHQVHRIQPLPFKYKFKKPLDNQRTDEFLTDKQLKLLLKAIYEDQHPIAGPIMLWVLNTGMRRRECYRLKWEDLDFDRNFITIRNSKSGRTERIPMSESARQLLTLLPKSDSEYVFPGRGGRQLKDLRRAVNKIRDAAGLPPDFRAMHGLRHAFASMLASSGKVDLFSLQKLLTHKSPAMTQRYAHLIDDALHKASMVAGETLKKVGQGD